MVSEFGFAIGIATLIFTMMAVITSESGDARILFTILAASGYFYGGFALLASAFNAPMIVVYVLSGICILGTIVYAAMNASAIIRSTTFGAEQVVETQHAVNLAK